MKIVCIAEIDTRYITTQIRNNGAMKACIIIIKKILIKSKKETKWGRQYGWLRISVKSLII